MELVILYIKTHTATGIKYFGRTVSDPYSYSGSGTQWKKILRELGAEHTTEVYGIYTSREELESAARKFSIDELTAQEVSYGSRKLLLWVSPECGHEWERTLNQLSKLDGIRCPVCYPFMGGGKPSFRETELFQWLKERYPKAEQSRRDLLKRANRSRHLSAFDQVSRRVQRRPLAQRQDASEEQEDDST